MQSDEIIDLLTGCEGEEVHIEDVDGHEFVAEISSIYVSYPNPPKRMTGELDVELVCDEWNHLPGMPAVIGAGADDGSWNRLWVLYLEEGRDDIEVEDTRRVQRVERKG